MTEDVSKLVLRAQKGDKDAYGEIYGIYLARIFRFIYYLIRDYEISQDITQNTFVRAWNALPSFSTKKGTVQAYLFTIARNLVIDYQRRKKPLPLEQDAEFASIENLEEKLIEKDESENLYKAIKILDDVEKQMVILRYFEELSFKEVAKVVGQSEGSVRVRTHRILKKLKEVLK